MARPPRDPRDTRYFTEMLRRLGINPDSVRIIVPRDGADQLGFPDNDNVIPFPKSGSASGKRASVPPASTSVSQMLRLISKDVLAGRCKPDGAFCILVENVQGGNDSQVSIYHAGLNRYEQIGVLTDAAHDVMSGLKYEPPGGFDPDEVA